MILDKERFMNAAKIEEDDPYVDILLPHVQALCMDVARAQTEEELAGMPEAETALLYAAVYLYENRANADYLKLMKMLRQILMSRNPAF